MRFMLIDRITRWEPGVVASGIKNVSLSEDFFDDHFPLKPIMPGALILEGMAQLSGLLLEESVQNDTGARVKALMSIVERAKFRRPAYPGDTLCYDAAIDSVNELGGRATITASIDGEIAAQCTLVFSFTEFTNPGLEARRSEVLNLWLTGRKTDAGR